MSENDRLQDRNEIKQRQLSQIHNIPLKQNQNSSLIEALKQTPSFLQQKINQKLKNQNPSRPVRAGGVYMPPHKLRALQQQILQKQAAGGLQHQKMMWQLLRKSINGIVNKVNISNIQNIVIQLFNENILRGKGLLSKSIIKAQMASPNFTHVYAALIAVINTKLPQIGNLIMKRVMIQFKRAFERNNKIVCIATTKMIAHLINQRVLGQYVGLQLLFILLNKPSEASVQIACDFMIQAGQILSQITPAGATAIFERFKTLLHQGEINQKAQYSIQNLFAIRKTGFKQHPGVIPELDLVQIQDQIIHNMDFQQDLKAEENLNVYKFDPFYQKTQQQWDSIKLQILGEQNIINLKQMHNYEQQMLQQMQQQQQVQQKIQDLTQQDLINLRRTIYLIIQSTVNFQQCAHKLLKMNITKGYQHQLVDMIIQCCMMQRIYQNFFGLLAERFCLIDDVYKENFIKAFINHYNAIFKLEVNKIRNIGRLFGHLLYRFAIDWKIFQVIVLKPQTTTAAGRMFLKIIFKQIAQNLGMQRTIQQFNKQQMREYYQGIFPIDHPNNLRFAINYFTSIQLGPLTQNMRQILQMQEQIIMNRKQKQQEEKMQQQLKQQEQLLRLMEEQQMQKMKILNQMQQQRKRKNQEIEKKIRQQQKKEYQKKQNQIKRKRRQSSSSSNSSSSSSSSSSGSSSSSSSSSQSYESNKDKRKNIKNKIKRKQRSMTPEKRKEIMKNKREQRSSQESNRKTKNIDKRNNQKFNRQKENQKLKQKQRQKQLERQRQLERQIQIEKQKELQKQRQIQSQKEKEKERLRIQKQKQIQRQKQRQIQKQKERQKQKQRLKQREKQRQRSRQKSKRIQNRRQTKKKRVQSSSNSNSDSERQRKIKNKDSSNKYKIDLRQKKQGQQKSVHSNSRSASQSSGFSSSSSDSDSSNSQQISNSRGHNFNNEKDQIKSKNKKRVSSSSSSSSRSSVDTNQLYRRKLKKQQQNRK